MRARSDIDGKVTQVTAYTQIPYSVFGTELEGSLKNDFNQEVSEIMGFYDDYYLGAEFSTEGTSGDYVASCLAYKKAADLINKEARFLFSIPPTFTINPDTSNMSDKEKEENTNLNDFLSCALRRLNINSKLVKAAKDCFIGKRVACMLNFSDTEGITATFLSSTEFLYRFKGDSLDRIVAIYILQSATNKSDQIIKKKIYEMGEDGYCYVEESLYSGTGELKEEGRIEKTKTLFNRIPAVVILNDGLSNDTRGCSDIADQVDYEAYYSKLANADMDSERKSMNPIRYAIDASQSSTKNLSSSPGSFWDIQSEQNASDPKTAQVGMLEAGMNYSNALKTTLDRIENTMYSSLEIPNINSEKLQGVITSGKTLKALYWSLIVRCNEKMLTWTPALEYIAEIIIEGSKLYPKSADVLMRYDQHNYEIPDIPYEIRVENNYPLPEDEQEEKTIDLSEVAAQTMSRKSYMKKWRNLTDEEIQAELKQIALERQMLEDTYMPTTDGDMVEV